MKTKNLIVTAHIDSTFDKLELKIEDGKWIGTIDNILGCMLLFEFQPLLMEHNVPFYFTQCEEHGQNGIKDIVKNYDNNDTTIINIDGCLPDFEHITKENRENVVYGIDSINKFRRKEIYYLEDTISRWFPISESPRHTKSWYRDTKNDYDYQEDMWIAASLGYRGFTFGYPLRGQYHSAESWVSVDKMNKYRRALKCVLYYFIDEKENA